MFNLNEFLKWLLDAPLWKLFSLAATGVLIVFLAPVFEPKLHSVHVSDVILGWVGLVSSATLAFVVLALMQRLPTGVRTFLSALGDANRLEQEKTNPVSAIPDEVLSVLHRLFKLNRQNFHAVAGRVAGLEEEGWVEYVRPGEYRVPPAMWQLLKDNQEAVESRLKLGLEATGAVDRARIEGYLDRIEREFAPIRGAYIPRN